MKTVTPERLAESVGRELGASDWFAIDQARIDAFADATLDHQFIHVDPDKARHTPFGTTIAHGFLTLSLLTPLSGSVVKTLTEGTGMIINYGFDRVRFVSPVRVGARVRARGRLAEVTPVEGGVQAKIDFTIEIEGTDRPAVVAEQIIRAYE